MQTYLKTKPVWMQLLLFLSMAFGIVLIFGVIGGVLLSNITGMELLEMGDSKNWNPDDPNTLVMIRGMVLIQFLGLFLVPSLLFAYFSDSRPGKYLGFRQPWNPSYWILGIAALLFAIPLVEFTGMLNRDFAFGTQGQKWVHEMEEEAMRTIKIMLGTHSISQLILNLVFIAVFAGIGEELFFRGILQRILIRAFKAHWPGIIIAAFFFSFFHFQFLGFFPRFLLGILLGAIYWYSGSIWTAIVAHFAYDAFFIIMAYFQPAMIEDPEAMVISKNMLALGAMALISTLIIIFIVWQMKRMSRTTYAEIYEGDFTEETNHKGNY